MHNLDTLSWVCRIQGRSVCALDAAKSLEHRALPLATWFEPQKAWQEAVLAGERLEIKDTWLVKGLKACSKIIFSPQVLDIE